ncbi:unnamed protein product [Fusarium fujikuroi]|nr:unnamed protein product [Fusarium fujikuroi]VZH91508.1 unnamed protein product [Fusarium fujikuroi]
MTVCGSQTADGGVDREPLQLLDSPKDPRRLDTRRVTQRVNEVTDEKREPIMNILAGAEPETESKSIRGPKVANYLVADAFKCYLPKSHLGSSLISMGGDDITGSQIMGLCRRGGVFLHMQDFLKIANLWLWRRRPISSDSYVNPLDKGVVVEIDTFSFFRE